MTEGFGEMNSHFRSDQNGDDGSGRPTVAEPYSGQEERA